MEDTKGKNDGNGKANNEENKAETVDDILKFMYLVFDGVIKNIRDVGMDKKALELVEKAKDADEVFKSEMIIDLIERMNRILIQLQYLNKPVRLEDTLRVDNKGNAFLGREALPPHQRLEYFSEEKWKYGVLHINHENGHLEIWSWDGRVSIEQAEGVAARLR